MKKLLLLAVLLLSFVVDAQTIYPQSVKAVITRVKDGDTYVATATDASKTVYTIRQNGIDCPEKAQPFGKDATKWANANLLNRKVTLTITGKDMYGRTNAWVLFDGKFVSRELLNAGLAWHYKKYNKSTYLKSLENKARAAKIGLWSVTEPRPIYPSDWRAGIRQ